MKIIYIAAPLGSGPDREQNRVNASKWVAWVAAQGHAPVADWVILSGEWSETPENRARGLACDFALIARVDELWLVGGRISRGMKAEADEAIRLGKVVVDMTELGALPPIALPEGA